MTSWQLYWITRLDDLNAILITVAILALVAGIVAAGFAASDYSNSMICPEMESSKQERIASRVKGRIAAILALVALCAGILGALTPTTKDMAAIIIVPRVANSKTVEQVGDGLKKLAAEWLEELRPNNNKENK